jgi:hypothetical protein
MALVKLGGGIVGISGSIAGNTFARNRYGNYMRARTKPINPNSSRQQVIRSALAALTTKWSQVLTAAQRESWKLYGESVSMLNRLGESIFLTGFNHFLRSNIPLAQAGEANVLPGPTLFELPITDLTFAISISEATQLITLTFDDTATWCDEDDAFLLLYQGSPQNAQRNFFAGPWRYAGKLEGDSVTPPATSATVACSFVATEAQKIWVYARILRADGRMSQPFRADVVVGA